MSGPGIPNYLDYPWRRRGLDHDRFLHRNLPQAKPTVWPGKARVALWVAVHVAHFPMDMPRQPFVAPGGVDRPYPSYWDYTQRDYGNRVGIYRLMRALDARGLRATALLNAAVATRYPALVEGDRRQPMGGGGGRRRHGPSASWRTARSRGAGAGEAGRRDAARRLRLEDPRLAFAGAFRIDAHPRSRGGGGPRLRRRLDQRRHALSGDDVGRRAHGDAARLGPVSDQRLLFQQHMDTAEFVEQVLRAFKTLYAEAASTGSGRILTLTITPWLMGQPHRIRALGALLDRILELRRRLAGDRRGDRRCLEGERRKIGKRRGQIRELLRCARGRRRLVCRPLKMPREGANNECGFTRQGAGSAVVVRAGCDRWRRSRGKRPRPPRRPGADGECPLQRRVGRGCRGLRADPLRERRRWRRDGRALRQCELPEGRRPRHQAPASRHVRADGPMARWRWSRSSTSPSRDRPRWAASSSTSTAHPTATAWIPSTNCTSGPGRSNPRGPFADMNPDVTCAHARERHGKYVRRWPRPVCGPDQQVAFPDPRQRSERRHADRR